jgi:hypothetical protein
VEPAYEPEPEPDYGYTDEVMLAEIRAAKVDYLHAAVDALAAVELWLALDAWVPESGIPTDEVPGEQFSAEHDAA